MNAFNRQDIKRRAQNAYLSEDNPGCLLLLVIMLVSTLIALAR